MKSKIYKRKYILIGVCLCIGLLVLFFFFRRKKEENPKNFALVKTQEVKEQSLSKKLLLTGELEPKNWLDIKSKIAGRINSDEGIISENTFVPKNQVLASVDREQWEIKLQKAQASYDMAKSSLEIAFLQMKDREKNKKRIEELYQQKAISEKQREMADLEYQRAIQMHQQALASLHIAKATFKETKDFYRESSITAPFAGIIAKRYFQNQDLIIPNTPLFRLMNVDELILKIHVPEKFAFQLKKDMQANFSTDVLNENISCNVDKIYPFVDPKTRTVEVDLVVDNKNKKLLPGFFVKVNLELEKIENALVIPEESIVSLRYVYVVNDGKVNLRQIKRGLQDHNLVEVLEGLEKGEEIVVAGHHKLSENMPIQKLNEEEIK